MALSKTVSRVSRSGSTRSTANSAQQPARKKRRKGNKPGSRHSLAEQRPIKAQQPALDKRVGSKKPIALTVTETQKKSTKPTYFSPKQELQAIESDEKLNMLLDKADNDQTLSAEEAQYLEEKLARHKSLCELLGINQEPDDIEPQDNDSNLLNQLNTSHLEQYKP